MARGRPKGSRNKPKSDSNGIGHNGGPDAMSAGDEATVSVGELTDEQRQALFFQHKRNYKAALEAKKAADAELKNTCKLAKAELGNHAVADIKTAIELESPEGEAELKARIERNLRVARWMGASVGTQGDMFGDGVDRTPAVDKAFANGKRAGLAGDPCNPECDPSSAQYQSYMAGFHEGQAVLAQGIKRPDPPPMDLPHSSQPADMSRAEWKEHLARQNEEVAADIKAGAIGTEPATAAPTAE